LLTTADGPLAATVGPACVKVTIDVISTERNVVGNLVGTYHDLAELMVLAQA
jgi:hypothetical protein